MTDELTINQVNQAVSQGNVNLIIEFIDNDKIECVTCYKSNGREYDMQKMHAIFLAALQHENNKRAVIHGILLHFVQNSDNEQSLKEGLEYLGRKLYLENGIIITPTLEELASLINYQDTKGNTLLHQAVISNNTDAIEALLKYGASPLIKNKEEKIPLDLDQEEKTREALIECMKNQAKLKKGDARCNSLIGIIPGVFLALDSVLVVL
ncbi:ankyrin repeat domain-containing protein [Wolbachia pipientis]|uniref:ankyrin repeat domain-containing protein n=1 Tax=Wolbachia pipientis TaxID=955 RepID=UPI0020B7988A|nr:ankyrin repeat domain-containing protein [Wolbachia pipientis]